MLRPLLVLSILVISACSSVPNTVYEKFEPRITDAGLQLFTYKAVLDVPREGNRQTVSANPSQRELRKKRQKIEDKALRALEAKLEESKFCPHGYFISDKFINRTKVEIRGECKSIAANSH